MDTLNQMELQDIRHACGASSSLCKKLEYYKTVVTDQNALDIFNKVCTSCDDLKQDLTSHL